MKIINKLQEIIDIIAPFFNYIVIIFYILYISLFLGINVENEKYIQPLRTLIRMFIGLFLIVHFNPYIHKTSLNNTDINIIMSSGIVILLDAGFSSLIDENLEKYNIKNNIRGLFL